ncbi:GNAT family N-acetyltransferase [Bisgaard Taxon 10/6]|uniref:GNAT family N-acetyltransferase n=1 Tax=Exercitatus varius TaxID=67857 RepID=A0ABT6ET38_9PAST|nr:GNAT family N-acetyltransferase [Exercitatus varius]MDG2938672.1 GNAT family N-acetyltransferase [Exercitatus varius]MDG2946126.1 GNAT family N-acetyltransferase [Exercitatus varius]
MTIQSYTETDAQEALAVFQSAVQESCYPDYSHRQIQAWCDVNQKVFFAKLARQKTFLFVLKQQIVGLISAEQSGYLDLLFVKKAFQNQGIASQLLSKIEDWLIEQKIEILTVESSLTAKSFFEQKGFQLISKQQVELRNEQFINFKMSKQIAK